MGMGWPLQGLCVISVGSSWLVLVVCLMSLCLTACDVPVSSTCWLLPVVDGAATRIARISNPHLNALSITEKKEYGSQV